MNGDTSEAQLDRPRSYSEIFVSMVKENSRYLAVLGFLFFSLCAVVSVGTVIHIQVMEVGVFAVAEAAQGTDLAEKVYMPGLYINIVLYFAAAAACLYEVVKSQ